MILWRQFLEVSRCIDGLRKALAGYARGAAPPPPLLCVPRAPLARPPPCIREEGGRGGLPCRAGVGRGEHRLVREEGRDVSG